ncbi:hypothetical protein Tco_1527518 [Tanacetum coccineum]
MVGGHITLDYRREWGRSVGGNLDVGLGDGCSNIDDSTIALGDNVFRDDFKSHGLRVLVMRGDSRAFWIGRFLMATWQPRIPRGKAGIVSEASSKSMKAPLL